MPEKLKAVYTLEIQQDSAIYHSVDEKIGVYPFFPRFREWLHQFAHRHGFHDALVGSRWYRWWGSSFGRPRYKTMEQELAEVFAKELREDIDRQILEELSANR